MTRLLSLLFVLCVIAPALLARGGQMRARFAGGAWGMGAAVGVMRVGFEIRWGVRV